MRFLLEKTEDIISRKCSLADLEKHMLDTKSYKQQWSINKWIGKPENNSNTIWYVKTIILENESEQQN